MVNNHDNIQKKLACKLTHQDHLLLCKLRDNLRALADPKKALVLKSFFKTGPGQYAHGDEFLGVPVPMLRKLCKEHEDLTLSAVLLLLKSQLHEERLLALLILVRKYQRGSVSEKARIYRTYLANTRHVNNWDLVDLTAPHIVGDFLLCHSNSTTLRRLAASNSLWERRIAVVATLAHIRAGIYRPTLALAAMLLDDQEDLIHKAVGWMLREVGKRNVPTLERFLARHAHKMPRTMLRYAIERLPLSQRHAYLTVRSSREATVGQN